MIPSNQKNLHDMQINTRNEKIAIRTQQIVFGIAIFCVFISYLIINALCKNQLTKK
ncbi:hypothetical protein FHS16_006242 [Paenibacillus endophyticus]|uniref:Uncharacterized protein n=1 Tax=Paenibacillus endophyticus TaxID=1294268 RepID=A0A7W5CED4_9BACL|nr:hypothetical protein [Paenibacillus endophyticus]